MDFRTGVGLDFHRLADGEELWIGGIKIPSDKGTVAHSDGDVLIHAICDAILGAAGLRDIGVHFPDNDPLYRGIDSKILLGKTIEMVGKKGFSLGNIDSTVCLERPKLSPYIEEMCYTIAGIAGIKRDAVSVKATTTEKMGFAGREEGVAAVASVLLKR